MDDRDYIGNSEQNPGEDELSGGHSSQERKEDGFMPHTQSQERLYRGEGVGRKESTFGSTDRASSVQSEQEPKDNQGAQPWRYPEPEVISGSRRFPDQKKTKSSGSKLWVGLLIGGGVAAAVAVLVFVITFALMNGKIQQLTDKLNDAQSQVQATLDPHQDTTEPGQSTPDTQQQEQSTPDTVIPDTQTPEQADPNTQPPVQTNPGTDMTPAQVYAQCVNSVVAINCKGTNSYGQTATTSSGSGFILSEDGYVVTNYHVVEGQSKLEVATYDGTTYTAEYIGGNEANDIALIKMDGKGLIPVAVGVSADLVVGEQVAAIGNPLGELASTLTVGYISAKDRIVATDGTQINMLQTDAAINPGNSGGPLFNMKGEVIGITTAKYSGTTTSGATIEGIGFAIPIDDVLGMLNDLREYGYITGGYLGISASDVDPDAAELYGLPKGVLVREITSGSCAEKAGMKVQDIIVNMGGYEISNLNDLSRALNKCKAGETVTIKVYRSGVEKELSVTLDERPKDLSDSSTNTQPTTPSQPSIEDSIDDWFDFFLP